VKKAKTKLEHGSATKKTNDDGGNQKLKALHEDIDTNGAEESCEKLTHYIPLKIQYLPSWILKWLVPEMKFLTKAKAKAKKLLD